LVGLAITVAFAFQATHLRLNASFESMAPTRHPYLVNYLRHRADLQGLNNTVRIAVESRHGTVFDAAYPETLKRINDEGFLIRGVDRTYMRSLWTPSTRWIGMTEEGFEGGPVIPDDYDGSARGVQQVRANIERSGEIGQSVALNRKSTI